MMKLLCFWPQSLVHLAVFWWLCVCVYRNEKAAQLPSTPSLTRESRDPQTPSQEPPGSVGTDPGRIMGKEVKEEQNRLKGFTVCWLAAICAYYVTVCLCSLFSFFFLCFLAVPNSTKNAKYPSYDPIGVLTSDVPFLPSCPNDFLASIRSHIRHSLLVQFAPSFVSDKALLSVILNFQEELFKVLLTLAQPIQTFPWGAACRGSAARAKTGSQDKQYSRNSRISTFSYPLA